MAQIKCFVFNHIEVNTYLVYDETLSCVVIDPGMETAEENEVFTSFINRNNLKIKAVLLTHTHIDHISGLRCLYDLYKTPVYLHEDAKKILHQAEIYASVMGFETGNLEDIPVTTIDHGGIITFGQSQIRPFLCRATLQEAFVSAFIPTRRYSPATPFSTAASDAPTCPRAISNNCWTTFVQKYFRFPTTTPFSPVMDQKPQ